MNFIGTTQRQCILALWFIKTKNEPRQKLDFVQEAIYVGIK